MDIDLALRAARVDTLPVIDMSQEDAHWQIGAAARDIGFFYIINHGVPEALIADVYARAQEFFALPAARKAEIAIEQSACHRGYFVVGGENLDPEKQKAGDLKEGIKIGRDLPLTHPRVVAGVPLHGPNLWPAGLPGWREVMQTYYDAMEALGRRMMQEFARALDLEPGFFDQYLGEPMTTLGPLHYPPQTGRITEAQIGAGAHTDYGCVTLLAQDETGGLQVRAKDGSWIEAPPVAGSFVVNIGDMMERWTNGVFTSTLHRVVNASGRERFSLPFFFDPDYEAELVCLETCLAPGDSPKFPPTTAGQHLLDKINASFTYHKDKDAK
jgi:isopenicillin N synthase-like dioxygenase